MEEFLTEFIDNRSNHKFCITFAKDKDLDKRFPNHGFDVFEQRAANYLDPHFKGIHLRKFKQFDSTKDRVENFIMEALEEDANGDINAGLNNNVDNAGGGEMSPTSKLRFEFEAQEPAEREESKIRKEMSI